MLAQINHWIWWIYLDFLQDRFLLNSCSLLTLAMTCLWVRIASFIHCPLLTYAIEYISLFLFSLFSLAWFVKFDDFLFPFLLGFNISFLSDVWWFVFLLECWVQPFNELIRFLYDMSYSLYPYISNKVFYFFPNFWSGLVLIYCYRIYVPTHMLNNTQLYSITAVVSSMPVSSVSLLLMSCLILDYLVVSLRPRVWLSLLSWTCFLGGILILIYK